MSLVAGERTEGRDIRVGMDQTPEALGTDMRERVFEPDGTAQAEYI